MLIDKHRRFHYNGNMKKKSWFFVLIFAVITVDGEVVERINLSKVRESRDIVIETAYGSNTVHVEPGAISVTEADCPDHICVLMGRLTTDGGMPIICMPHRLMIEIEDDGLDG